MTITTTGLKFLSGKTKHLLIGMICKFLTDLSVSRKLNELLNSTKPITTDVWNVQITKCAINPKQLKSIPMHFVIFTVHLPSPANQSNLAHGRRNSFFTQCNYLLLLNAICRSWFNLIKLLGAQLSEVNEVRRLNKCLNV